MAFAVRVAAALGLLAAAGPAAGRAQAWSTRGPAGGNAYCVVADPAHPSTLYAGTDQGVFRSDNAGSSWRAAGVGLPAVRVQTIALDPTATGTLYAGTLTPNGVDSVGIFKSTDGGANWTAINDGLVDPTLGVSPVDVAVLAIDPRNPGTIIAGTRFSEIFKSTDGGATWQAKTSGGYNLALVLSAVQFDPSGSARIYAASSLGLLRSTDAGENWFQYGNANVSFFSLVVDPTAPATLYAGNTGGSGIFKSTDGGAHWSTANKGLPVDSASNLPLVLSLAVDPSHPSTVYAGMYGGGLFQSTSGGSSWARADSGFRDAFVASLTLAPGLSSTVYAGTLGGGVYLSLDSAHTWAPANGGFDLSLVNALASDPAAARTVYAATFDGVQKTTDGGNSWSAAGTGLPVDPVVALVLKPGGPETLFAGTQGGGLQKSADSGATWSAFGQGLADSYVSSIAIDPGSPATFYAGTAHPYDGTQSERVYKSTDAGATWTRTGLDAQSFSVDFLAVNPSNSSQIVAVSRGASGYFQSMDAGKTWSTVTTTTNCGGVNAILFSAGSTLSLAGTAGFCRSTDGGKTWTVTSVASLASVRVLLIDPSIPSTLYAGVEPSVSGGTGGVFRSTDDGQSWVALGTGLSAAAVTSLFLDGQGHVLHAGIRGGGVAELSLAADRPAIQPPPSTRRTKQVSPR
jgi:photosystem II stability/assembly factor-like uncharacterized protein